MFSQNVDFMKRGNALPIYLSYYRTQCLTSASVERLFSAYSYLDTAQIQGTTDDHMERLMLLYSELPSRQTFDYATAVKIWSRPIDANRRIAVATMTGIPSAVNKCLVRSQEEILKARCRERRKRTALYTDQNIEQEIEDYEDGLGLDHGVVETVTTEETPVEVDSESDDSDDDYI
jgi:hypothetical protein